MFPQNFIHFPICEIPVCWIVNLGRGFVGLFPEVYRGLGFMYQLKWIHLPHLYVCSFVYICGFFSGTSLCCWCMNRCLPLVVLPWVLVVGLWLSTQFYLFKYYWGSNVARSCVGWEPLLLDWVVSIAQHHDSSMWIWSTPNTFQPLLEERRGRSSTNISDRCTVLR